MAIAITVESLSQLQADDTGLSRGKRTGAASPNH